jgi:hypothetical protein
VHDGLHGALERCGASLLLTGDERALLAPTQRVTHDLGGAQRHVEHGQSVLQAAEGQLLHDVDQRRDAAHTGHRLLVEEETWRWRAASEVTLPSTLVLKNISAENVARRVALIKCSVLNTVTCRPKAANNVGRKGY